MPAGSRYNFGGSRTAVFGLLVRDVARPADSALAVRSGARVAAVVAQLAAGKQLCAVVMDAAGRLIGILTPGDILRRVTFRVPPDAAIETVMTAPVLTIPRREHLSAAIASMRRHHLRQLPVVDRDSRLTGIILLQDALSAAADGLLRQIDRLGREDTLEGMQEVKAAQVELAEDLFADHVAATEIQQLLTCINNDMYRRVGEASLRQMAAEGWGQPPATAATIVMGSGGRGESFLFPDQDNGFIIADYPDSEQPRIDAFFLELAERMCRDLNAVGIPYCNGYCMAVNPLWRKTLPQWHTQVALWTRNSSTVAIRLADIFFDFQPVWGEASLARELRAMVTPMVRQNRSFLRQMFLDKSEQQTGRGLFGGFVTERDNRQFRGQVNLKYAGTLPLISSIRLLALREGIGATSTLDRITGLADAGVLDQGESEELCSAFRLITDALLRRQLADFRAGRSVTYYVDPAALDKRARTDLRKALGSIHALRKRAHLEFTAHVF